MNKTSILRDLEYLAGGLSVVKTLFKNDEKQTKYYSMFDTWQDIVYNLMDEVEEEDDNATNT